MNQADQPICNLIDPVIDSLFYFRAFYRFKYLAPIIQLWIHLCNASHQCCCGCICLIASGQLYPGNALLRVDQNSPKVGCCPVLSFQNFSVNDNSSANSGSICKTQKAIRSFSGAFHIFTQSRCIYIIFHRHRYFKFLFQNFSNLCSHITWNILISIMDRPCVCIHITCGTDSDSICFFGMKSVQNLFHTLQNTFSAFFSLRLIFTAKSKLSAIPDSGFNRRASYI